MRYLGELSNCKRSDTAQTIRVVDSFSYTLRELAEPTVIVNGWGSSQVVGSRHLALLQSQLAVRPRRPQDHMNLLAMVNRRVAAADPDKRVSPFCHVSFIGETDGVVDPPVSQVFASTASTYLSACR